MEADGSSSPIEGDQIEQEQPESEQLETESTQPNHVENETTSNHETTTQPNGTTGQPEDNEVENNHTKNDAVVVTPDKDGPETIELTEPTTKETPTITITSADDIIPDQDGVCEPLNPGTADVERAEPSGKNDSSNSASKKKKDFIKWLKQREILFCVIGGVTFFIGMILIIVAIATMHGKCTSASKAWSGSAQHNGQYMDMQPEFKPAEHEHDSHTIHLDGDIYQHMHSHESNITDEDALHKNLAEGKMAYQSSTSSEGGGPYNASLAIDGKTDSRLTQDSCAQTEFQRHPFWYVDLGSMQVVKRVKIFMPSQCCVGELHDFEVRIGQTEENLEMNPLCKHHMGTALSVAINIVCDRQIYGRYVSIQLLGDQDRPRDRLTLCEVMVFPV